MKRSIDQVNGNFNKVISPEPNKLQKIYDQYKNLNKVISADSHAFNNINSLTIIKPISNSTVAELKDIFRIIVCGCGTDMRTKLLFLKIVETLANNKCDVFDDLIRQSECFEHLSLTYQTLLFNNDEYLKYIVDLIPKKFFCGEVGFNRTIFSEDFMLFMKINGYDFNHKNFLPLINFFVNCLKFKQNLN